MESKNFHSWCCGSHISPGDSQLLGESLKEVYQSVKPMLKLIQEYGDCLARKDEYQEKKPELIAHVEEFYRMYQTLVESFNHLSNQPCKNISSELQIQGFGTPVPNSDLVSPFFTPNEKLNAHKSGHEVLGLDMHLSSSGGSSDLSLKDGSESSSHLSFDSEYETFYSINKFSSPSLDDDGKGFQQKISCLETEVLSIKEKLEVTEAEEYENYQELRGRITKYEEEQEVLKKKLHFSEKEVATLKCELTKEGYLAGNLRARLDSALGDIVKKNADIDSEKRRALQMQNQVIELVTQVSYSNEMIRILEVELEFYIGTAKRSEDEIIKLKELITREVSEGSHQLQGQLELVQKDIAKLEAELYSERRQVAELQERTVMYIADLSARDHEVRKLKAQLQAEISSSSEQKILLEERLNKCELQTKSLQDEVRQFGAEKTKMKSLHEAREIGLQCEIHLLKEEQAKRGDMEEVLNKNLDMLKLKYDMLKAEKDELYAQVQTLTAEKGSQNNSIRHIEEHLNQLQVKHFELIAGSDSSQKLVEELRLRVEELETELGRQRVLISEGAEEKREAIRQLCFSLEHYRSGYRELRQAFIGHRRLAAMAS